LKTYQTNQLTIDPAQNVGSFVSLRTIDDHTGHQNCGGLLIEASADVVHVRGGIGPTEKQTD